MPMCINFDDYMKAHINQKKQNGTYKTCSIQNLVNEGRVNYSSNIITKYHIGDSFEHNGIIVVITDISDIDEAYQFTYLDAATKREITTDLKVAWFSRSDVDNIHQTMNDVFNY